MDTLVSLRLFCAVAEFKSFTAAADRLGLSPAMASKHVSQLEHRLGSRLLNRTSRRVSLTEAGTLYFAQARQMLEGLDEVEAAIGNATLAPRGTLKLSAPVWVASAPFVERMADYNRRYPTSASTSTSPAASSTWSTRASTWRCAPPCPSGWTPAWSPARSWTSPSA